MEERRGTIKVTRRAVNTSDRHRWTGQHGTSVFLDIGVPERVGTSILSFRKGGKKRQINTKKEGGDVRLRGLGDSVGFATTGLTVCVSWSSASVN